MAIKRKDSEKTKTGPSGARRLRYTDRFMHRHIGPTEEDCKAMLELLGFGSMDEFIDATVPRSIRTTRPLALPEHRSEYKILDELREIAAKNSVFRSFIGMGYHACVTPPVIQRNILENPGWYTQYTPYQAEISQGRLEALLNFQTMICDLTGMEIANASLLDEGTAAAEAMNMSYGLCKTDATAFFVSERCHPQTIDVVRTRAAARGLRVLVGKHEEFDFSTPVFGVLVQYPATSGEIIDYGPFIEKAQAAGAVATMAADLLSLALLRPPAEFGADIAVGTTQRFGVPLGYGGPHAAYFATRERHKRLLPGRLVGVSRDAAGRPAYRLALQTREQHIRREKATSNICTAQVLLAIMAGMYAVYHGPKGLKEIAGRIHRMTAVLAEGLRRLGFVVGPEPFFDTLEVQPGERGADDILKAAAARGINLRRTEGGAVGLSLNETASVEDLQDLLRVFSGDANPPAFGIDELADTVEPVIPEPFARTGAYLTHPVFNRHHSETELLRYIHRLQKKDLSLTTSMIPLGSCTMKLNATAEMYPVSWPEFGQLHPFAPLEQTRGYQILFRGLEEWLAEITGFAGVSLQPNSGAQGELAGLLVIRGYLAEQGQGRRDVCLIPESAHGTNPASAVMAGMKVVVVACDGDGNIDLEDLKKQSARHAEDLSCLMVTYPSTHGVFEDSIREVCEVVHRHGGQVYMDGANMNAQVGLCRPGEIGADVCHLNLHKTFSIPHGGGGPGMGPIAVARHLVPYLPSHPVVRTGGEKGTGAISAAPWGSASVLPISWVYIALMGGDGLTEATKCAILNANYIARRLDPYYPVLYKGQNGLIAHECIIDLRHLKKSAGIEVEDVAKRLMDYSFHAPTVSFPVAGTLMVEPTESESKEELDRFCDAMIAIHEEIREIEDGRADRENNLLKNAPHTPETLVSEAWDRAYPRERAAFPLPWVRENKFWPPVGRIDGAYGDRNLVCSCTPVEEFK